MFSLAPVENLGALVEVGTSIVENKSTAELLI